MNINEIIETANREAKELTDRMNAIFSDFPHCEAEEHMPDYAYNDWSALWKLRNGIFDRITRVEQAANTLSHYLKMEVI